MCSIETIWKNGTSDCFFSPNFGTIFIYNQNTVLHSFLSLFSWCLVKLACKSAEKVINNYRSKNYARNKNTVVIVVWLYYTHLAYIFLVVLQNFLENFGKIRNLSLEVMILKILQPSALLPWLLCTTDCQEEGLMPYHISGCLNLEL